MNGSDYIDVCIITDNFEDLDGLKNEAHLINLYICTNKSTFDSGKTFYGFKSVTPYKDKSLDFLIRQGSSKYVFFAPQGVRLKENTLFYCLTELAVKQDHGVVAIPASHFRHSCLGFAVADVCFMLREAYSYQESEDFAEEVTLNAIFSDYQIVYLNNKYFNCGSLSINHSGSSKSVKDKWVHGFPEGKYLPVQNEEEYYRRVKEGYQVMSDSTVVICGLARDVKHSLETTGIFRIEYLASLFKDYYIITYENDSRDRTGGFLNSWAEKDPHKISISENLNLSRFSGRETERTERLAHCRNICLDRIKKDRPDFDYYIPIDLDLMGGFSYDGIAHSISHDDWALMGSNGKNSIRKSIRYWDTFPHRDLKHHDLRISRTQMMRYGGRYASLQRGDPLLEVNSCFGGMGVYKMKNIIDSEARYSGETSEHVIFNKKIKKHGGKIFVNPSQILLYNYIDWCEDHNGDSFKI